LLFARSKKKQGGESLDQKGVESRVRCSELQAIIAAMSQAPNVAVLTGSGGTGCGRALAIRFAAAGASVVVSDINEGGGLETVRRIEEAGGERRLPSDLQGA
jgi:H2-forming N5,N10-methylenetetrahydromethanopterin dehydrogenase-like enzyme